MKYSQINNFFHFRHLISASLNWIGISLDFTGSCPLHKYMLQDGLHKTVLKEKSLERLLWHSCIKHNNYHVEVRPDFDPSCQIPNYDVSIMSSREENSWIKWMRFKYKDFIFMSLKLKIQDNKQEDCLKYLPSNSIH